MNGKKERAQAAFDRGEVKEAGKILGLERISVEGGHSFEEAEESYRLRVHAELVGAEVAGAAVPRESVPDESEPKELKAWPASKAEKN